MADPDPDHLEPVPEPMLEPEAEPVPVLDPEPVPVPGPQSAWKARIRLRVAEAVRRLEAAYMAIESTPPYLAAPMTVADATASGNRIQSAVRFVKAASHHLFVFSALAQGAGIFVRHAASVHPEQEPLPDIHHLGDQEEALQSALSRLDCAMGRSVDAYRSVQYSRAHLETVLLLLDHPGLGPDLDAIIDLERSMACSALDSARIDTSFCLNLAGLAREDMDRAN